MGFWRKIFGFEDEKTSSNEAQEQSQTNTVIFVTSEEEQSFQDSLYGQLQIYGAEIEYIKEVLPERGEALEKQIELLTRLLEVKNDEKDSEVIECFLNLKAQYEEDKRMADGEYTIRELEAQNDMMDRIFEKSFQNGGITKSSLDKFITYIGMIQDKVNSREKEGNPILTNVQRQKFNNISLKSEYRIKMLELMYLIYYGNVELNPFRELSVTKQKIFSKFFWEDAQNAEEQYEYLSYYEELFNEYNSDYFRAIDGTAQKLNEQMRNVRMVGDFSIRQLFDSSMSEAKSFEFLKDFISFKTTLNEMRDKKQEFQDDKEKEDETRRQQEEDARKRREQEAEEARIAVEKAKEELEKLKNITTSQIDEKIQEINSDLKGTGNRFINILEFQKKVAKAKGLLDINVDTQLDELYYKNAGPVTLVEILRKANAKGINYIVYPNSQESKLSFIFVVSNSDKDVTEVNIESDLPFSDKSYYTTQKETLGAFDVAILRMIAEKVKSKDKSDLGVIKRANDGLYDLIMEEGYSSSGASKARKRVRDIIGEVKGEVDSFASSQEYTQNILCYLQVPAIRNIIPILEKLKASDVEVFLEPVPKTSRNDVNRENIHIYFRREDLEKVRNIIGGTPELQGSIGINADEQIIGKMMKKRAIWPEERQK